MFDEYVTDALGRAKVQPISLSTPLLDTMVQHIESKTPGSLLIAGMAGDGKTYHCRALWTRSNWGQTTVILIAGSRIR